MPTLVDSFLVEFGIDPAKFVAGAKVILESQKKSQETARKTADEIEKEAKREGEAFKKTTEAAQDSTKKLDISARQMTEFFSRLRGQVMALFAIFTAGKGLKEFIQDQVTTTAALGRTSYALDLSVNDLAAWRGAVEATGGSAEDAISGVGGLVQEFQRFTLTGQSDVIPVFRQLSAEANKLGVPFTKWTEITKEGGLKDLNGTLLEMADVFHRMDPARANVLAQMMHIPPGLFNLLVQGKDAVRDMLETQRRFAPTAADVKAYQDLQKSWQQMNVASESLGRSLLTMMAPAFKQVVDWVLKLGDIAKSHQPLVQAFFAVLATGAVVATIALFPIIGTIGLLGIGIAALAAGVAILYDSWVAWTTGGKTALSGFWNWASGIFNSIKAVLTAYVVYAKDVWTAFISLFTGSGPEIRASWGKVFADLRAAFDAYVAYAKNALNDIWEAAKTIGPKIGPALLSAFHAAMGWLGDRINAIWNAITGHDLISSGPKVPSAAPTSQTVQAMDKLGDETAKAWAGFKSFETERRKTETHTTATEANKAAVDYAGRKIGEAGAALSKFGQSNRDVDLLMRMGWTREQAIGIAANLQRESSGNIAAVGDKGTAYGLAQWHPDRQAQFAKLFGHDIRASTRAEQLQFVNWELRNSESGAGRALAGATTAEEAARIVSSQYERPGARVAEAAARASIAAQMASVANTYSTSRVVNNQSDTRIAEININAPNVTDSSGIAATIGPAIKRQSIGMQANYGAS